MKKRFWFIAAAAVLLLTGCGQTKAASDSTATRTVTTAAGKVKLPVHPKRVVSTVYTGELMSLGVKVVGATSLDLQNPWLTAKQTKGVKDLGNTMNQEAILKLHPDLIVTSTETDVKKLKAIAPVLYIPYGSTGDVYATLTKFGQLLNRKTQAKQLTTKLKTTAKNAVADLKAADIDPATTTVSLFDMQANKLYADGSTWGRGGSALVTAMGFKLTAAEQKAEAGTGYKQISTESLPSYAGEWMFFSNTTATKNGNDAAITAMKTNPVWQSLSAVKKGHVISLPFNKMYYYDPQAVIGQIKLMSQAMIKQK